MDSLTVTDRRLRSVPEACEYLGGVSREYLYKVMRAGQLHAVKLGRRTFIDIGELDRFIDEHSAA